MRLAPVVAAAGMGAAAIAVVTISMTRTPSPSDTSGKPIPLVFQHDAEARKLLTPHFVVDYSGVPPDETMARALQDRQTVRWPAPGIVIQDACDSIPDVAEYIGTFLEIAFKEWCIDGPYPSPTPDGERYTVYVDDRDTPEYEAGKGIVFAVGRFNADVPASRSLSEQITLGGDCFHEFFHAIQWTLVALPSPSSDVLGIGPGWLYEGTATYYEGLLCMRYLKASNSRVGLSCQSCFSEPGLHVFNQGQWEAPRVPVLGVPLPFQVRRRGYGTALLWSYLQSVNPRGGDLPFEFFSAKGQGLGLEAFADKVDRTYSLSLPDLFRDYAAANFYFARRAVPAPHAAHLGLEPVFTEQHLAFLAAREPGDYGPGLGGWSETSIDAYGALYIEIADTWTGGVTISVEEEGRRNEFCFDVYPGSASSPHRVPKRAARLRQNGDNVDLPAGRARRAVIVATRVDSHSRSAHDRFRLKLERNDLTAEGPAALHIRRFTHHVDDPDGPLPTHFLMLQVENTGGEAAWIRTFADSKHVDVDPGLAARRRAAGAALGPYHLGLEWKLGSEREWHLAPMGWTISPRERGDRPFEKKALAKGGQTRTFIDAPTPSQMRSYAFRAFLIDPAGTRVDQRDLDPTPRPMPATPARR